MKTTQDYPTINDRPPEGVKDDRTPYKVLVVDDSMFVAKQLGQILTSGSTSNSSALDACKPSIS